MQLQQWDLNLSLSCNPKPKPMSGHALRFPVDGWFFIHPQTHYHFWFCFTAKGRVACVPCKGTVECSHLECIASCNSHLKFH